MRWVKSVARTVLSERALMHLQAIDHYWNGEPEIRIVPALCEPGRDAVDAGANIGTYSYFFRRYARRVHAYEPNPRLALRLGKLLPDVRIRNVALSDQPGELVLRIPVDAAGAERHELASVAQAFDGPVLECPIEAITLDSERLENVGFIKVDVEQHERPVLRGALDTIRRCNPVVMTEATPLKYGEPLPAAFSFLLDEQYVGWFRFGPRWLPFAALEPSVHLRPENFGVPGRFIGGNLIFFPCEHRLAQRGPAR
jgi:FkbM family methyltransferase